MKSSPAWFESLLLAVGLTFAMLLVMWAQSPAACAPAHEASRVLVLSRQTDREHLATDVASATRRARRWAESEGPVQQAARLIDCEAALVQAIAATHGLSPDLVRANPASAK